jgi:predicted nucleic acid-binding protein
MTYLLDTAWIVGYLHGEPRARALLDELAPRGLAISSATFAQLAEGPYAGLDPERGATDLPGPLGAARILVPTRRIEQHFGQLRGQLRRRGIIIGDPNLLLAVTALHHDLTLVTTNLRDFARVPGLKLHRPTPG